MITDISKDCIATTAHFECGGKPDDQRYLKSYLDSGGIWTIGIGTTHYPNGQNVKKGDIITPENRDAYYKYDMRYIISRVIALTRDDINQHQFDALCDLAYNIGPDKRGLQTSTLLKLLNKNLIDPQLVRRFLDWRYDNGKEIDGLLRRRMSNAYLYFTGELKFNWINFDTLNDECIKELNEAIRAAA